MVTPTPKRPKDPTRPLTLREHTVLVYLSKYFILTSEQLNRLIYTPRTGDTANCVTTVRATTKKLRDRGLIDFLLGDAPIAGGRSPLVHRLSDRGLSYLRELGYQLDERFHRVPHQFAYVVYSHTLAVNDVLISAELLTRRYEQITIPELVHERAFRHKPFVMDFKGERVQLEPDSWINFQIQGMGHLPIALELDRGTEVRREVWVNKIKGYLAWLQGPYEEHFGLKGLTIATVTTAGDKRLEWLVDVTEHALTQLGFQSWAHIFQFLAADPALLTPEQLFTYPVWQPADGKIRGQLIPLEVTR